ncbi:MAG: FliI/YscN family ATPase [Candidatus Zixiibacteriota bacterium]
MRNSLLQSDSIRLDEFYPKRSGIVQRVNDISLKVKGAIAKPGEVWKLANTPGDSDGIFGEVTKTSKDDFILSLYDRTDGIAPGSKVDFHSPYPIQTVGESLLGRVFSGKGTPFDNGAPIRETQKVNLKLQRYNPLEREIIKEPLSTGIRSIDSMITIGKGQKIGLFAASGVGKSVLMGMISRGTNADIRVIAMIGERGREVREFIQNTLGDSLPKSVVVAATSDTPPLTKVTALLRAFAIARYFASQGNDVLLMVDSLTRIATALRDVGLSAGEPPVTRGYTAGMYNFFPLILEQAGNFSRGSLTLISTVLVEEDLDLDPVGQTARAILDGHIVLSPDLAKKGFYPAIDVLRSKSRVMPQVVSQKQMNLAQNLLSTIAVHREYEDVVSMGLYAKGSNPKLDKALEEMPKIDNFLKQGMHEMTSFEDTIKRMESISHES